MSEEKPQTIEQRENIKNKHLKNLAATARNIISFEVGMPVGVRKLSLLIGWLEQDGVDINLPVIGEYLTLVNPIPSGKERLYCARDALQRYDSELNSINLRFHDRIIDACFELIKTYGEIELPEKRG